MLEYLSTVKNEPLNFRQLAGEFLDVSRIISNIEAGLTEASRSPERIPGDMLDELDQKFRQVNDNFIVLNQMLVKFLESETKGGIVKGWRMMFADTNIDKMRETLARNREALKISALVFRWSVGDERADASMGIGCTALAAALGRINHQSGPAATIPPRQMSQHALRTSPVTEPPELLPPMPLTSQMEKTSISISERSLPHHEPITALPGSPNAYSFQPSSASRHSRMTTPSAVSWKHDTSVTETVLPDDMSEHTIALTMIEDLVYEADPARKASRIHNIEVRADESTATLQLKADPAPSLRYTPKQTPGANSPAMKVALKTAIQQNKHKMIEQLLTSGVSPEGGPDIKNLTAAILKRDIETVRLLLLFGADSNSVDGKGLTPLLAATEMSFLEAARILVEYGADPNLPAGTAGESPLVLSVAENWMEFVELFMSFGGDANNVMPSGNTVLVMAMNKTTPKKLAELLLTSGTDANGKNGEGVSPLFTATQAGRTDLMTLLLDHGANPNLPGPKHLLWPATYQPKALQLLLSRGADFKKAPGIMELATSLNNKESVSILLEAGVDPNVRKDGIYTPLCTAIRDNRSDLVALLLANGADPNFKASEYPAFKCVTHRRTHLLPQLIVAGADLHTPKGIVETAVGCDNKEALLYLLEHGVNPNDRSPEGHTALTSAIRDARADFVNVLLQHGANPCIRGQDWPISMAVSRPEILAKLLEHVSSPRNLPKGVMEQAVVANQLESIKLLLQAGVSVEDKTGGVFSPLTTALRERRKDLVKFLLDEAGADANAPGEHLPIIKAIRRCEGRDYEMVEMLLERGADVNLMYRGWNAILQAVEGGDVGMLRVLVEKAQTGVDLEVELEDEPGRTVRDVVKERGWGEAEEILIGGEGEAKDEVRAG